ncbi:MAG: hypothetical protein ACLU85_04995 [Lachnospirales bacterium]
MRKLLAFVFAFTLLCSQVVFAMPATSGNADYIVDENELLSSAPQVGYIPKFSNTVDLTGVKVILNYYDMSSVLRNVSSVCDSSGHFSISRPDDFAKFERISITLDTRAFPSSGKYKVQCLLNPEGGATNAYNTPSISFGRKKNNVEWIWEYNTPKTFTVNYSQAYWESTVQLGSFKLMEFIAYANDWGFSFNGHVKIAFTEILDNDVPPDISSPGSGSASQDIQQGIQDNTGEIAGNTSQLVDGQNQIVESLKDIVQTISYQLEAFWLQLAHEFTNLYNKMNEQHAEIMQAIQDGLNVTINNQFDELIENDNKNHQEQIQNDNQNTDKITNGYDNSSLNQSNQNLSDALNEYQSKEDELLGQTTDKIENFQFDNPFTKFIAPLQDVAYMLNGIYVSLGSFNIPIGFSLTLTIALLCIGWYRFRGGG